MTYLHVQQTLTKGPPQKCLSATHHQGNILLVLVEGADFFSALPGNSLFVLVPSSLSVGGTPQPDRPIFDPVYSSPLDEAETHTEHILGHCSMLPCTE